MWGLQEINVTEQTYRFRVFMFWRCKSSEELPLVD